MKQACPVTFLILVIILASARIHQIKDIILFAVVTVLNLGKPTEAIEKLKIRVQ